MTQSAFDYRVRVSARSRRVCLRVTLEQGLEIVVPRGYDMRLLPGLLKRKDRWIRRTLERIESYRSALGFGTAWELPRRIELAAAGLAWGVDTRATGAAGASVREAEGGSLVVSGAIGDERAARRALRRWLVRRAESHLVLRLQALSLATGLRFRRVSFRCQKTRWGSCSRDGAISLNARLLFLPPELVDYVLVHELCHLAHMNHSKRFWSLVARHCPDFRACDRRLRETWKQVPRWA